MLVLLLGTLSRLGAFFGTTRFEVDPDRGGLRIDFSARQGLKE